MCVCDPPHLFRALPLHLGCARRRSPEHAGCDADGQVEGVHLVVVGVALDTVQHGDHVSQQEQVLAGQEVEQPEREEDGEGGSRGGRTVNDYDDHGKPPKIPCAWSSLSQCVCVSVCLCVCCHVFSAGIPPQAFSLLLPCYLFFIFLSRKNLVCCSEPVPSLSLPVSLQTLKVKLEVKTCFRSEVPIRHKTDRQKNTNMLFVIALKLAGGRRHSFGVWPWISYLWTACILSSAASPSITSIHCSYRSTLSTLPGTFRRKSCVIKIHHASLLTEFIDKLKHALQVTSTANGCFLQQY